MGELDLGSSECYWKGVRRFSVAKSLVLRVLTLTLKRTLDIIEGLQHRVFKLPVVKVMADCAYIYLQNVQRY